MLDYRRAWSPGGTWFFTLNLLQRNGNDLLIRHIDLLRATVYMVRLKHPFAIHGWVVLPEHMHCIISLPGNETDFALRWRLIKSGFSKQIPPTEYRSPVRSQRGERGIWQRRYWEHLIRDEADYAAHIDYIHINPVKHGLVGQVVDWPYSTLHRYVEQGVYPRDWAGSMLTDRLDYVD